MRASPTDVDADVATAEACVTAFGVNVIVCRVQRTYGIESDAVIVRLP